ncbi:hypothetical protein STRTUCAR8_08600 [Streptomyces turgidiscabies Car8]|uniref:Uncharacterized protein n=1 Tax=Streptomyces turgidiscabies (strain Car8) TaxID=698760 RepID=L7FAF9_STRT8|nr:hypothetical protein [Streptomyces turgidiscabies]ELP67630.1 hypothetical protein STRTUCAR8_08600 [Streptomyces turgidiscabies Car8]
MKGQLTFDDCMTDWPAADRQPRQRPAGTRYLPRMQNDLWGQRLPGRCRIVTIPISGEYL